MRLRHRLVALLAAASLTPVVAVASSGAAPATGEAASVAAPTARATTSARAGRYQARIRWTQHGIPHVVARDWGSLGFGSGYAAADSSICTLADTVLTARGQRSRYLGPDGRYDDQVTLDASNLQVDAFVTDLRNRRVVEKLLASKAGPGRQSRLMVDGYVAGINRWLRTHRVTDPACRGRAYLRPNATSKDLWYGVYLANLLASAGVFVKEIVDADPPSPDDPGLPEVPLPADVDRAALLKALGRDPGKGFGSNATAIGRSESTTGRGMLLGNPHFPWRGRYHFTQQHLTIPGHYNVAGASLIGSPAVNIGWNRNVAWSHTVSTAYRFTPYEYRLASPVTPTTYLTDGGTRELERRTVKVRVLRGGRLSTVEEDVYRTPQGYVVDSPATLMPWSPLSVWAIRDANAEHLRTVDTFLDMGKARGVRDLLRRQDAAGGMPWVNTTAADRSGNVVYADHSVVPNVPNDLKNACLTAVGAVLDQVAGLPGLDGARADGDCKWRTDADAQRPGIFGPRNLPESFRSDWVFNANDSYWTPNDAVRLEGFASIIGCEQCERTMRSRMVARYVTDRIRGDRKESPATLAGHQYANRVRAAEVMRAGGDLDAVCDATGETAACAVLKAWNGRSDRTSVGVHIFEEFVKRAPTTGLWEVPFDPEDPFNTPRDLNQANPQVQQAMADAIEFIRSEKVRFDAPWGRLQVAGDRGAPALPLGGGLGDLAGNANALASSDPVQNRNRFRAITYGSSHIQAIAFLDGGRVLPRTILTYSQYENPRSRFSSDQTRMFSQERWVPFAWTEREIRRQLLRVERVSGG